MNNHLFFSFEYCTKLFRRKQLNDLSLISGRSYPQLAGYPPEISKIEIISAEEKNRCCLISIIQKKYRKRQELCADIREQVLKNPGKIAVIYNDRHITYHDLNEEANRISHFLSGHDVRTDTIVVLYLKRSITMLASIIGVFKAGGAIYPLKMIILLPGLSIS